MNKILVTGSNGFLGKNLQARLKHYDKTKDISLITFDKENEFQELESVISDVDFIYHLAGVNRSDKEEEFFQGNHIFTKNILDLIKSQEKKIPIVYSSSTQAELDNNYGKSKRLAEIELMNYSEKNKVPVFIYRLPNLFGKWSLPNYNSVVATFCHNTSRDIHLSISDPEKEISLAYIDDVVEEFVSCMDLAEKNDLENKIIHFNKIHKIKLGELAEKIKSFEKMRAKINVPEFSDELTKFLYSTYLSYLPKDGFAKPLKLNKDERGSFIEFVKTPNSGQFSVSTTNPGQKIIRGNHYHDTKTERFFVLKGEASVKFRDIFTDEVIEYLVSEKELKSIDIPPGYTHSIINKGDTEMILLLWANEQFDPEKPDTYPLKVKENE